LTKGIDGCRFSWDNGDGKNARGGAVIWSAAAPRGFPGKKGLPDAGGKTVFARLWKRVCGAARNLNGTPGPRPCARISGRACPKRRNRNGIGHCRAFFCVKTDFCHTGMRLRFVEKFYL